MRDNNYNVSAVRQVEEEKIKTAKSSILTDSLNSFFLNNVPKIKTNDF